MAEPAAAASFGVPGGTPLVELRVAPSLRRGPTLVPVDREARVAAPDNTSADLVEEARTDSVPG